jgi:hypothetical protein
MLRNLNKGSVFMSKNTVRDLGIENYGTVLSNKHEIFNEPEKYVHEE